METKNDIYLDQSKSYFRLNHFVLWSKGWYKLREDYTNCQDNKLVLFETLRKVLALDGYCYIWNEEDIILILANNLREYNTWAKENKKRCLEIDVFMHEVATYIRQNGWSYFEALVYTLKNFFGWMSKIELYAPAYNKKLTKFGLVSPHWGNGVTYTWLQKQVDGMKFLPAKPIDYTYLPDDRRIR